MSIGRRPTLDLFSALVPAGPSASNQTQGGPVLRRTCDACAASKLKCSSEKPTCSRCAKRGERCVYFVAKRGGRKPNSSRTHGRQRASSSNSPAPAQTDEGTAPASPINWFAPSTFGLSSGSIYCTDFLQQSDQQDMASVQEIPSNFAGTLDQNGFPTSMDVEADLTDLFSTPSFAPEMTDFGLLSTSNLLPGTSTEGRSGSADSGFLDALAGFEDAISDLSGISASSSRSSYSVSNASSTHNLQQTLCPTPKSSHCICFAQALGYLKQLSSLSHTDARSFWSRHGSNPASALQSIQGILGQNDTILKAMTSTLKCNCSGEDGYLLTVVSLIIFKVLDWYSIVGGHTPRLEGSCVDSSSLHRPASSQDKQPVGTQQRRAASVAIVGDYSLDGEESARMTAQLILSELHRVRRLVDEISTRLQTQGSGASTPAADATKRSDAERHQMMDADGGMGLPMSAFMYQQLEVDLRKYLRALSKETISRLKRL